MVRSFRSDPIPAETLDEMLDLARRAPSAGNTQATAFIILDTEARRSLYWDVTLPAGHRPGFTWPGLLNAPVLVLVTTSSDAYLDRYRESDKSRVGLGAGEEAWAVPYWWVDAGAVIQNLLLLCVERGLGACLFGPFDHEAAVAAAVELEADRRIVATIAIGVPDQSDRSGRSVGRNRPGLDQVILRPDA